MATKVDRDKLDQLVLAALDTSRTVAAMHGGQLSGREVDRAEATAERAVSALQTALRRMADDLDSAGEREETMLKRAMVWGQETVPHLHAETITFSFDAVMLREASDWRTVAREAFLRMMEETERRLTRERRLRHE